MKIFPLIFLFALVNLFSSLNAQSKITVAVKDSANNLPLYGANIIALRSNSGASTNEKGIAVIKLKFSTDTLLISYIGFYPKKYFITKNNLQKEIIIFLSEQRLELNQVMVSSSRINSYINSSPQRIEVLGEDELNEKTTENPGNISEMLSELSAVQMVQTSLLTGNTNFRLLGLYGRYAQLLENGFPIFGGMSQSLSFMQIPPLNLKQVEIIKGASSTYFGEGAVAGIINLITKVPSNKSETNLLLNLTSHQASDFDLYFSGRHSNIGITTLASMSIKNPVDVNGDGFTEIPKVKKFDFEPNIFVYFDTSSVLSVALTALSDDREGGYLQAVNNPNLENDFYFDKSTTTNYYYSASFMKNLSENNSLQIKNSIGYLRKKEITKLNSFLGQQNSSFTEITYSSDFNDANSLLLGGCFSTEKFNEDSSYSHLQRNFLHATIGVFTDYQFTLSKIYKMQFGLRYDNNNNYGGYFLPSASFIYKPAESFFVRLNLGTGYSIPSLFSSDENVQIMNVEAPSKNLLAEKSKSASFDIDLQGALFGELYGKLNQILYLINVSDPLALHFNSYTNQYFFVNESGPLESYGTETNLNLSLEDINFMVGLSYGKTKRIYANNSELPLSPQLKVVSIFSFEEEGNWSLDLGSIYTGAQNLDDGTRVKPYATFEGLFDKKFDGFDVILNFENIFNYMQSNRASLYSLSLSNPKFAEIYSPVVGREFNLALKYSF